MRGDGVGVVEEDEPDAVDDVDAVAATADGPGTVLL